MEYLNLLYKGAHSNTLYTAYYDGSKWHGNDRISSQPGRISPESNYNPGAAVFNNWLYIVYKGAGSNALFVSWHDGNKWSGNVKISDMNGGISPESSHCPNLIVYNGLLITVYKGADSNALFVSWFDGATWYGNKKISDHDPDAAISPESNYNPGMAVFDDKLYIVYKGAHSNTLYTATFDGVKWAGNTAIKDQGGNLAPESNYNPGAVLFDNKLYIVYKGAHSNTLYSASYDGSNWAGNTPIKDQDGTTAESNYCPQAAVYNRKMYIVYKGAHSNTLYSAWHDGSGWSGNIKIKDQGGDCDPESNYNPGLSVSAITPASNSDWMGQLSDALPLSEINIPGAHDAAAIRIFSTPYACHNYSISDQLKYGIRLLDVRLQISQSGSTFKLMTCHGDHGSIFGLNTYQSFSSLLDECKAFLDNHSREVVLMSLKVDDWSDTHDKAAALVSLADLLKQYPTTAQAGIAKLGDVRGQIFLYNRIDDSLSLGVPIEWSDNTDGSYASNSANRSYNVYVQDRYQGLPNLGSNAVKLELVKNAFLQKKSGEVVWNFASATWYGVFGVQIMGDLLNYFGATPASGRLATFGWTLFDHPFNFYPTSAYNAMNIVQLIISSNFNPRYVDYDKAFEVVDYGPYLQHSAQAYI